MVGRNLKNGTDLPGIEPGSSGSKPERISTTPQVHYLFICLLSFYDYRSCSPAGQLSEPFQHRGICCAHERVKNRLNRAYFYGG